MRIGAVKHTTSHFILVESEQDESLQRIARLRHALRDAVSDPTGYGIQRTGLVLHLVAKEAGHVPHCRETDAKNLRIFDLIDDLIQRIGVEAVFDTDHSRIWNSRKGSAGAIGERPLVAMQFPSRTHLAIALLRTFHSDL